jgi:ankyrin repeat protein
LMIAAMQGFESIVRLGLQCKADIHKTDKNLATTLDYAVENGHHSVVKLLLENYGNNEVAYRRDIQKALGRAASKGRREMVQLLLEYGADIRYKCGEALVGAILNGHDDVLKLLVERGADVNSKACFFGTVLQAAVCEGNEAAVRFLIENGADLKAGGGYFGTVLQAARHPRMVTLLREMETVPRTNDGSCM